MITTEKDFLNLRNGKIENSKTKVIVGMEPTGPYWLPFARWLQTEGYWTVTVNPAHVKKSRIR